MAEADGGPTLVVRLGRFAIRLAGRLASVIPTVAGFALLTYLGYWSYTTFLHGPADTYGQLLVDSPEIYTRERLVNDRFVEDAWLRRKLRDTGKVEFGPTGSISQSQDTKVAGGSAEKEPGADGRAERSEPQTPASGRNAAARFLRELDYRREIRNMIIENQLDDRHDLRGNSLYRLKFDASVLPGENTRANALISVTLEEPEQEILKAGDLLFSDFKPDELIKWRSLYEKWLRTIGENINKSVQDLQSDYRNDRFSIEYFRDLINDMRDISRECKLGIEDKLDTIVEVSIDGGEKSSIIRRAIEGVRQGTKDMSCDSTNPMVSRPSVGARLPAPRPSQDNSAMPFMIPGKEPVQNNDQRGTANSLMVAMVARGESARPPSTRVAALPPTPPPSGEQEEPLELNALINRFAAPKLSQLAFGTGRTSAGKAAGSSQEWEVFVPFANVTAIYRNKSPFKITPYEATLTLAPKPKNQSGDMQCKTGEDPIDWNDSNGLCLNRQIGNADDLLKILDPKQIGEMIEKSKEQSATVEELFASADESAIIKIEFGLYSFIRELQQSRSVFSYAVTPKQSVQTLSVDERTTLSTSATGGWQGIVANFSGEKGAEFRGERDQPLVVGYGNASGEISGNDAWACDPSASRDDGQNAVCPKRIEFGWFISPPVQGTNNQGLNKIHAAAQYALTALVSVPAWWEKINLKVEKAWLDEGGKKRHATEGWIEQDLDLEASPLSWVNYWSPGQKKKAERDSPAPNPNIDIDLPSDLESITLLLLDRGAGPEIEENRMEPIAVTACRPASMLLPGRRLWRSAVVTLGSQVADEIQVLPNMRGIIAKFDQIEVPSGWSPVAQAGTDETGLHAHEAPVTVWTSEGSRTLRRRANIIVPSEDERFKSMTRANGTCQPLDRSAGLPN